MTRTLTRTLSLTLSLTRSDDAAALLESRAREAKRQALKDQAAARRAMIQAAERSAQANRQQMEALNRVESLYRDLGMLPSYHPLALPGPGCAG